MFFNFACFAEVKFIVDHNYFHTLYYICTIFYPKDYFYMQQLLLLLLLLLCKKGHKLV